MKKKIIYDQNALDEFNRLSQDVQKYFSEYIVALERNGRLDFPEARKITRNIFEIRVIHEGSCRGFYAYVNHPDIVILHFFQKKTQKTPISNIKIAERRLQRYAQ